MAKESNSPVIVMKQDHSNTVHQEKEQIFSVNIIDESSNKDSKEKRLRSEKTYKSKWNVLGHSSKDLLTPEAAKMAPNGNVTFKVKNSISISKQNLKDEDFIEDEKWDAKSTTQLGSKPSLNSSYSALVANLDDHHGVTVTEDEGDDGKQRGNSLAAGTADQYIKDAIPFMPLPFAVLFCICNIIFPGSGTILSGFSVFLCGKTRVQTKDNHKATTCCVNVWVGFSQMFTVTFMLVGWFWSVVWGIYMIILSVEYRNSEKRHKEKQKQAEAVTAMNPSIRPWTLKT